MSARIDRRTALRRAAAPSLDFSLMPNAGELQELINAVSDEAPAADARQALLDAANRTPAATDRRPERAAASPSDAPIPLANALEVPERFRMRVRPTGHATLQPHDAPPAHGLQQPDHLHDDVEVDAAVAFIEAHRGAMYERNSQPPMGPTRLSEAPTLILFGRNEAPADAPRPIQPSAGRPGSGITLTPTAEEKLFWEGSTPAPARPAPLLMGGDDATLAEDIDPELDAFMAARGRRRFLAAVGVTATMLLLVAAAAAGLAVMAQPALLDGASEVPVQAPPPPRPARTQ